MQITVVNLPHDPESGFDAGPLDAFCEAHDVRSWVEHFYLSAGRPMLAVVVEYEPARNRSASRERKAATQRDRDPWRDLSVTARAVYQSLRQWRSLRARGDGVPVYVVFSNRQLAAIAERRPRTKEALRAIDGIGRAKCDHYAEDVFTILAESDPADGPTAEPDSEQAVERVADPVAASANEESETDAS